MKFAVLVLPILLVVLVSGCVGFGGGGVTYGNGVIILNWEPDFPSIESGDNVRLYLRVQNQGGAEAKDVRARITGIDVREWGTTDEEEDLDDITKPDPTYGTSGGIKEAHLNLEAPELAEGITQTYHPIVRVYYEYTTAVAKPIMLVSEDELRRLVQQGKSLPTSTTQYSAGPILVDIRTGDKIKVSEDWSRKTFPLTIHVENIGGGVVSKRTIGTREYDNVLSVDIDLPSGLSFETSDCRSLRKIELWKGKTADVTCEVRITERRLISEEKTIQIEFGYEYYIDASTIITVTGTEEVRQRPPTGVTRRRGWSTV